MKINFKIKRVKNEQHWGRSCFFGAPDLPLRMLKEVSDDEIFIGQFNLKEIFKFNNDIRLPKNGMLYLFYDIKKAKAIVRYDRFGQYDEKYFARVDFNNIIDVPYDIETEYKIIYCDEETEFSLFDERQLMEIHDEIILFSLPGYLILGENDFIMHIIIKPDDLLHLAFENIKLVLERI